MITEAKSVPWEEGCVHVYTGDGKGKTTAALGLILRATGHGLRCFLGQFMKGYEYGELEMLGRLDGLVKVEQFGSPDCIPWREEPAMEDLELARKGLARCREVMSSGMYDLVLLDEICVSVHFKLLTVSQVLGLLDARPRGLELVLTGRYAPQELMDRADLVTEMSEIKHPYTERGLSARDGIER